MISKLYSNNLKKILTILTDDERKKLKIIFFLMLIGMFFETFGIAMIIPFMGFLAGGNYLEKYPQLQPIMEVLGNPSQETFIIIMLGLFLLFYIVKNIYLIFLSWTQTKFTSKILANLSNRLFKLYLYQPYTFHLNHNSATLIRNIMAETYSFGKFSIQASLSLFSELFILAGIVFLLFFLYPIVTLVTLFCFGTFGFIFYNYSKNKMLYFGQIRQKLGEKSLKCAQEAFGGIKTVKLSNAEKTFLECYTDTTIEGMINQQKQNFFSDIPRFLVEIMVITVLVVIIAIILIEEHSTDNILPLLGIFGMAAFRLMPSFNRIMLALQNLKYGVPINDLLYKDLISLKLNKNHKHKINNELIRFNDIIEINNISYKYPSSETFALRNVSFTIKKGQFIGLIGESGAGKSTMADIFLGLLQPYEGNILVDGKDIYANLQSWQKSIGYVPQSIFLSDNSLRQNIAFGIEEQDIDDDQIWRVLKLAQLDQYVKEQPEGLNTIVGEGGVKLSGGQRQRIGIARALYHNPKILLLDEATSALDTKTESNFMNMINKLQGEKTIIAIAHRLSTIEKCDYIYQFENGQIVKHGKPKDILSQIYNFEMNENKGD